MATIDVEVEGVFPVPRERLWKAFDRHWYGVAPIETIHPNIVSQRVLRAEGDLPGLAIKSVMTAERTLKVGRKTWNTIWRINFWPPEKLRWEIVEGDGPVGKGTSIENTYSNVETGTLIRTKGVMVISGMPRFLARWVVRRFLDQFDAQDLAYVRRMGP